MGPLNQEGKTLYVSPQETHPHVFRVIPRRVRFAILGKRLASSVRRLLFCIRDTSSYSLLDFGPALQRLPDGSFVPSARTDGRSLGIDRLLARYPWADKLDAQIYLEGFDEGERWLRDTRGM